jgi:hypothetical protein
LGKKKIIKKDKNNLTKYGIRRNKFRGKNKKRERVIGERFIIIETKDFLMD